MKASVSMWVVGIFLIGCVAVEGQDPGVELLSEKARFAKKGLDGAPLEVYQDLSVKQLKLNLVLNSYFSKTPTANTVSFAYEGKTYYYRKQAVEAMDEQLKLFRDKSPMDVALVILVSCDKEFSLADAMAEQEMVEQKCDRKRGIFFMPEIATPEGEASYRAMMHFLTERYAKPSADRVPVLHWILHNEVDVQWVWTHAGLKTLDEFMSLYVKTLKITSEMLGQFNKAATPYISLTRNWNGSHFDDPRKSYRPINLIRWLHRYEQRNGAFNWGIAQHPYGDAPWNKAKDISYDLLTPAVSMANIEVLNKMVECAQLKYNGQPRKIILSEQGFTSNRVNSEAPVAASSLGSSAGETIQAASLLYTMAKLRYLDNIWAFHYHRYQDHPQEGSAFGLFKSDGTKKLAYKIYKEIKPDSSNVFSPGQKDFQDLWRVMGIDVGSATTEQQRRDLLNKDVDVDCSLLDR